MNPVSVPHVESLTTQLPAIRQVPIGASLLWLRQGWTDLRQAWTVSLAYGVLFAGLGWMLITHGWADSHFAIAFTFGFVMLAPLLAICFYAISRALERREAVASLTRPFLILRDNGWSLGLFALMLGMLFSLWERVTAIMVALTLKAPLQRTPSQATPPPLFLPDTKCAIVRLVLPKLSFQCLPNSYSAHSESVCVYGSLELSKTRE